MLMQILIQFCCTDIKSRMGISLQKFSGVLLALSTIFFETRVIGSFTVSDTIFLVVIIFLFLRQKKIFHISIFNISFFLVILFYTPLSVYYSERSYFDSSSFWNNYLRLICYLSLIFLTSNVSNINSFKRSFVNASFWIYKIVLVVSLIEYVAFALGINELNISVARYFIDIGDARSMRMSGVFVEPAHFAIYIGLIQVIVLKWGTIDANISLIWSYLTYVTLLLTFSFVGYAVLLLTVLSGYSVQLRQRRLLAIASIILSVVIILSLVDTNVILPILQEKIIDRTSVVGLVSDGSSSFRLLGSLNFMSAALVESNMLGVGLGQMQGFFESLVYIPKFYQAEKAGGVNNVIAAIGIQLGLVGLILVSTFLYRLFLNNRRIFGYVVLIFMGWGFFLGPLTWLLILVTEVE